MVRHSSYPPDIKMGKFHNPVHKFSFPSPNTAASSTASHSLGNTPFRRISFQEMQVRKAKGLCFNCDEKFTPSHKCATRKLLLLQWEDEPPDDLNQDTADFVVELDTSQSPDDSPSKLALNAMNSAALSGTLRFTGMIHGQPVQMLLDGGSDDNFIQPRLVQFLNLDVQPTTPIKVLVGNGNALQVEGYIPQLQVTVQGNTLQLPVYVLPIEGAKLILGAAWLATLGPHMVDYQSKYIQFIPIRNLLNYKERCPQYLSPPLLTSCKDCPLLNQ